MKALRAHAPGGSHELAYEDGPSPEPGTGDVLIDVRAAAYTPGELDWPSTWLDRSGHDRTPSIPCHEVSGVVAAVGFGVADLAVGDEVFGLTDWYRDGGAAEQITAEARNLAPKPGGVEHRDAATVPLAGLTASQALFRHGRLQPGWTVIVLGAAGAVGGYVVQLGRLAGARVLAAGPAADRDRVMALGAERYIDLDAAPLSAAGTAHLVVDTTGECTPAGAGALIGDTGRVVSIVDPSIAELGSRGAFFVVEPDREELAMLARHLEQGELRPAPGPACALADGPEMVIAKQERRLRGKLTIVI